MKRTFLTLLAALLCLSGAAMAWLGLSESGLAALSRAVVAASAGRLSIEQPSGRLLAGELAVARLSWKEPDTEIVIEGLHLAWSPAGLLHGRLEVAAASAAKLSIASAPSAEEGRPPASLRLPLAVDVEKLRIAHFVVAPSFAIENVQARYVSDGASHRLEQLQAQLGKAGLSGDALLGADAPFPLQLRGALNGQLAERAVRLAFTADGPLARIALKLAAEQGLSGDGTATLTPFARHPFAAAQLALADLDPAAWLAGAPSARLTVHVRVQPDASVPAALSGDFSVSNAMPGSFDRQRLPLASLSGRLDWRGDTLQFAELKAGLPGQGMVAGEGRWQDEQLALALRATALDLAQLAGVLQPTRLSGPLTASIGRDRQALAGRLADARFVLAFEASHENGKVQVPRLELAAGDATLKASGELLAHGEMAFATRGELVRFDPGKFARVPPAQINASFSADGRLRPEGSALGVRPEGKGTAGSSAGRVPPRPVVHAQFALRDSRLAGQPLSGRGDLVIDWPRIPRADVQLAAGPNQLSARGAFGQPGERLRIDLDAPALAPYGVDGGLAGHLQLGGTLAQPTLDAELQVPRLALPGVGAISAARVVAEVAAAPGSPLRIDARVAALDGANWPGLLRNFTLQASGTRRQHSLQLAGEVAGRNRLELSAAGGFADDDRPLAWSGRLLAAQLDAEMQLRSFVLAQPAPLSVSRDAWRLGPLVLNGDAWQLRGQGEAAGQRLQAELSGRGPRIGKLSARLDAALHDAWRLNRQAPWQGEARMDVADLAWVAEWLADGWKTGGRLDGELTLAGTPDQPLASGRLRGQALAVAAPELGMKLANGTLEATLADNLLRVSQLAFDSVLQAPPRALRRADSAGIEQLLATPGRLEISGEMRVDPAAGSGFQGRVGDGAALDLRLDRVGVYQLPDQWLTVSGDGRVSWINDTFGIRSKLAVDAAYWQLTSMGTPRLSDDVVIKRPSGARATPALRPRVDIDVDTDLGRNFHFRGAGLSARLAGSVRVQAQGRDLPRASGRIRTRDGRFDAYGQQLEIERGVLTFQGLLDNPAIDARAVRKGLPVEAGVQISGTAQKPVVRLVSDPELPEVEKLSWLVLGHGPEQGGAGDAAVLLGAAGSLLGSESGGVMQQIKQGFGIDEFSLRQGQVGDIGGRQPGSRVVGGSFDATSTTGNQILSVGRRLSNNALLSYEQTLGKAESVVKLTIALNRQLSLIARAGSDNALDALYTFTFGEPPARPKRRPAPAGE